MGENVSEICYCGKSKNKDRLTCPRCFELYREDLKRRGDKPSLIAWVKEKALKKLTDLGASEVMNSLTTLERELREKKDELKNLRNELSEKVSLALEQQLAGAGQLRQDEVEALKEDVRKELWNKMGGNRLFAERKNLERDIKEKVVPIRETLKEVERIAKENSSVGQLSRAIEAALPNKDK